MSRQRILKNIASNWMLRIWGVGWGIVMVPVYLKFLGKTDYGIWILINSVVGYYGLLGLGMQPSIVRYVARYLGLENKRSLNEIFNTAFVVQVGTGAVALGVSAALAVTLPRVERFALSVLPGAGFLIFLVGMTAALSFAGGGFSAALGGAERFDISNLLLIAFSLITNLGHIAVLAAGGGLIGMATVLLVVSTIEKPITALVALRVVPGLRFAPRLFSVARVREIFGYGVHAFVVSAGERLRFFTDAIVIGAFLPAASITIFRVGNRPMQFLMSFVRGATRVFTPAFSRTEAAKKESKLVRLLVLGSRGTALVSFLGCLLLAVAGDRLIRLWLGPGFSESFRIMLILIPAYLIETSLAPTGSFLLGTKGYRTISMIVIIEGVANLVLSLLLIRPFGLIGVALGTAIPMVVLRLFVLPLYACRAAGIGVFSYFREVWGPATVPLIGAGILSVGLVRWIPGDDFVSVVSLVAVIAFAYGLLAMVILWVRQDELLPRQLLDALPTVKRRA